MRVEIDGEKILVVLSRRNLETLISKLDGNPPDSACTIVAPAIYVPTFVKAEEDEEHYSHADRHGFGPGAMHPTTEVDLFVRNWEQNQENETETGTDPTGH